MDNTMLFEDKVTIKENRGALTREEHEQFLSRVESFGPALVDFLAGSALDEEEILNSFLCK